MLKHLIFICVLTVFEVKIDANVENANDPEEKKIIALWTAYLQSGEFKNSEIPFWGTSEYRIPDDFLWMVDLRSVRTRTPKVQCTVLGIFKVENGHYAIKTSLAHLDKNNTIVLEAILSVYVKKVNGKYFKTYGSPPPPGDPSSWTAIFVGVS